MKLYYKTPIKGGALLRRNIRLPSRFQQGQLNAIPPANRRIPQAPPASPRRRQPSPPPAPEEEEEEEDDDEALTEWMNQGGAHRMQAERFGNQFPPLDSLLTSIKWIRHPNCPPDTTIRSVLRDFQSAGNDYGAFVRKLTRYFQNARRRAVVPYRRNREVMYHVRNINEPMMRAFARYIDHLCGSNLERDLRRDYAQRDTIRRFDGVFINPLIFVDL